MDCWYLTSVSRLDDLLAKTSAVLLSSCSISEQFGPKEREFAQIVHLEKLGITQAEVMVSFFRKLGKIGRLRFKKIAHPQTFHCYGCDIVRLCICVFASVHFFKDDRRVAAAESRCRF
jgi:hypothetical protein